MYLLVWQRKQQNTCLLQRHMVLVLVCFPSPALLRNGALASFRTKRAGFGSYGLDLVPFYLGSRWNSLENRRTWNFDPDSLAVRSMRCKETGCTVRKLAAAGYRVVRHGQLGSRVTASCGCCAKGPCSEKVSLSLSLASNSRRTRDESSLSLSLSSEVSVARWRTCSGRACLRNTRGYHGRRLGRIGGAPVCLRQQRSQRVRPHRECLCAKTCITYDII